MILRAAAVVLFTSLLLTSVAAADASWTHDYEKAKTTAAAEDKDLLMDFTGSDWCGWCLKLKGEVFDQEPFVSKAPEQFVLVELDFPQNKQLPAEVVEQNQKLMQQHGVQGFPTIVLADAQGRPYARTGYRPGGAQAYMSHLEELRQVRVRRDAAFDAAEQAQGVERAKLLDEALSTLEETGVPPTAYPGVIDQIVEHDADNEAGLRAKYALLGRISEVEAAMDSGNFAGAEGAVDQIIADLEPTGDKLQWLLLVKGVAQFQQGQKDKAIASLEKAIAADPDGERATQIQGFIGQMKQQ